MKVYIDAESCPVMGEVLNIGLSSEVPLQFVTPEMIELDDHPLITLTLIEAGHDEIIEWITEEATDADIVISDSIVLAARVIEKGIEVLRFNGQFYTNENITVSMARFGFEFDSEEDEDDEAAGPALVAITEDERAAFIKQLETLIEQLWG